MRPIFQLKDLAKSYRRGSEQVDVFSSINMVIEEGDFISIMGPSGSGKTTLLNILGGIDQATGGQIIFDNEPMHRMGEAELAKWRARNVGFIFQFYHLMPMLTAAQNVELPLLLTGLGKKAREAQTLAALEIVGLRDRTKHLPRELSGGQQQRIAIARAIISDPPLLLCDEPTGDLDRATADEIMEVLKLLNTEMGKTIVMVTHDPVAARFARRSLRVDKGEFVEERVDA